MMSAACVVDIPARNRPCSVKKPAKRRIPWSRCSASRSCSARNAGSAAAALSRTRSRGPTRPHTPGWVWRVGGELPTRVGLLDDPSDARTLLHGLLGPVRAPGEGGLDGGGEQTGLAGGRAVHRLHGHVGGQGDRGNGRAGVALLEEQPRRRLDDAMAGLGGLLAPTRGVVPAAGGCGVRH